MIVRGMTDRDIHPPRFGGAQRAFGLARGLALEHDVRVLSVVPNRSASPAHERADGVDIVRRRSWHTSVQWRFDALGLAPMFAAANGHRRNAARYLAALGPGADVLESDVNLAGVLPVASAKLKVYASQNVEFDRFAAESARYALARRWRDAMFALEGGAVRDADLVVACTDEDAARFAELYGAAPERFVVIPNGYDERELACPSPDERRVARASFGFGPEDYVAVFVGADWGPNRDALRFLVEQVMPRAASAGVRLMVVGAVGRWLAGRREPWLVVAGEPPSLRASLHAADAGLNPVQGGGGSNVKLPAYLAAGLATLTTPFGARGYAALLPFAMVVEPRDFAEALGSKPRGRAASAGALPEAIADHAWSRLGQRLGQAYAMRLARLPLTRGAA